MDFSSIISNRALSCAVDTSIIYNLQACSLGKQILTVVQNPIVMAQIAADELKPGTQERIFLDDLVASKIIELTELTDPEYLIYEKLLHILDDGESATIAVSVTRQLFPFIDEKKGRAQATALKTTLDPGWSLDLLTHPQVVSSLGSPRDADIVYLALRDGRMRIPEQRLAEVLALIGMTRAVDCKSLPGYKTLFPKPIPSTGGP